MNDNKEQKKILMKRSKSDLADLSMILMKMLRFEIGYIESAMESNTPAVEIEETLIDWTKELNGTSSL